MLWGVSITFLTKSGTETEFPMASVSNTIRLQSLHLLGRGPLQRCFLEFYHPTPRCTLGCTALGESQTLLKIREAAGHLLLEAADGGSLKRTLSLWNVGCSCSILNASLAPEFLGQKSPPTFSKATKRNLEGLFSPLPLAGSQRKCLKIPLTQVFCYS